MRTPREIDEEFVNFLVFEDKR